MRIDREISALHGDGNVTKIGLILIHILINFTFCSPCIMVIEITRLATTALLVHYSAVVGRRVISYFDIP
jgi:hypothetical protein